MNELVKVAADKEAKVSAGEVNSQDAKKVEYTLTETPDATHEDITVTITVTVGESSETTTYIVKATDEKKVEKAKEQIQDLNLEWDTDKDTTAAAANKAIKELKLPEGVTAEAKADDDKVVITIKSGQVTNSDINITNS